MVSLTAQKTSLMFSESDNKEILETCGAGEMRVDDFLCVWVEVYKHSQDKLSSCYGVSLRTWKE